MKSVFSLAARRTSVSGWHRDWVRAGELKTDWTKPLVDSPAYGF
jgi:hypothetical protein